MSSSKLGFGMMRLPLRSDDPADIDLDAVRDMTDRFLAAGFTYFDTSAVYHGGAGEEAVRACLVSRYPREAFVLASKLPTFAITGEEEAEAVFQQQLERCGTAYFDYYLLHNVNLRGIIREASLFEHLKRWKEEGKIRHIGISFHDTADVLDTILTEHPEIEAVQIALNYFDWDARLIQAGKCYDTIRRQGHRHGTCEGRHAGESAGGNGSGHARGAAGRFRGGLGAPLCGGPSRRAGGAVRHVRPGADGGKYSDVSAFRAAQRKRKGNPERSCPAIQGKRPRGDGGFFRV